MTRLPNLPAAISEFAFVAGCGAQLNIRKAEAN